MKQKQVKAKAAKQPKATKKAAPPKRALEAAEESDDHEEEEDVQVKPVTEKRSGRKKASKIRKIVHEPSEDEEEEEGNEDGEGDVGCEEDDENEADDGDGNVSEDNENDDENDNESEEDNDDDDLSEDEDVSHVVKSGPIPATLPLSKVVHVTKLPEKCKQADIVEAFSKYGKINQVYVVTTPTGTVADVAFKLEKSAAAAAADDKKLKILDSIVSIRMRKEKAAIARERCIVVKNLKSTTTVEQLSDLFETCGEVETIKLVTKFHSPVAYVTFGDKSSVPEALKLHNSIFNDVNIKVSPCNDKREMYTFDERFTIMLKNKQSLEKIDVAKLENIFSKCGEIEHINVVCKKNILGFISFATEQGAQKALKLNGQTKEDIELELESYSPFKKWTSIHVTNLHRDCTEEDLTKHFSRVGEIANIILKKGFAIIRFNDCDGYCKSFLYNESFIRGQIIFIEPHSNRKRSTLFKGKSFKNKGFKRQPQNGHTIFKSKKAKTG